MDNTGLYEVWQIHLLGHCSKCVGLDSGPRLILHAYSNCCEALNVYAEKAGGVDCLWHGCPVSHL